MFAYIDKTERRNKIGRLGLEVSNFPFPTAVPMGGGRNRRQTTIVAAGQDGIDPHRGVDQLIGEGGGGKGRFGKVVKQRRPLILQFAFSAILFIEGKGRPIFCRYLCGSFAGKYVCLSAFFVFECREAGSLKEESFLGAWRLG